MKTKCAVLGLFWALSLTVNDVAFADRQLGRSEILQIFEQLTSQPRKTWISMGTIEAAHEEYGAPKTTNEAEIGNRISQEVRQYQDNPNKREKDREVQKLKLDAIPFNVRYKLSNQHTMKSTVVVRFDGNRFYWGINVNSRADSVKPGPDLQGNFMTRQFDLAWNGKRVFAWDGQKYTIYSRSGNYAMVDSTGATPHVVNGPLTAGLVPWGYGICTYENLAAVKSSAIEKYVDGQTQVHLTLNPSDGSEMLFVLDTTKSYALVSHVTSGVKTTVSTQYGSYQMIAGRWVPTTISTERYDALTSKLLASDVWDFTMVSSQTPAAGSFVIGYDPDALIEYRSSVTAKPAVYRYSQIIDTDLLLANRLAFAASEGIQAQNCATVAMKYAASQLGKDLTDRQLAQLIDGAGGTTSLSAMKGFALRSGLYCRAVRIDTRTLKSLIGCQVILHIPKKNHFVVLGDIDNAYVWSIDLASDKFCDRTDISFFDMDWSDGVALVISDRPILGPPSDIGEAELRTITGGSGYSCTNLLQEEEVIYCTGSCDGYYEYYPTLYGCEEAESGMCMSSMYLRLAEVPCMINPYDVLDCYVTGDWDCYYMRACS